MSLYREERHWVAGKEVGDLSRMRVGKGHDTIDLCYKFAFMVRECLVYT